MLARLQQLIVFGLLALAAGWLWLFLPAHPFVAWAGALLILLGYAVVLGIEFILLARGHGADVTPRASRGQLWRAWWGEVRAMPRVFFWRQPFWSNAVADFLPAQAKGRGVVLVHGLFCNRGFWTPWMHALRAQNRAFVAVNLEPAWGSLDAHAGVLEDAVRRVTAATGMAPTLIGHSMGGLVVRAWMASAQAPARVHRVISIASPHAGTWMARFSPTVHGRQMGLRSEWLGALQAREAAAGYARFVCWYSNADNMVFPPATGSLPGADNRFVIGTAHVALAFHPRVMQESLALL
ncbi:permease [Rhodoferax koreense]|uniref:Permease n=1 Tax=Rhodoferax koreensis TaxID=1842727 RepID=A0A1P8K1F2_9BURK|nr:alpha/beta fold hydrolase [Rhodoferax koreense]APW39771.1 permease [Rhodoferax koreense]